MINPDTGDILRPSCFDDLAALYSYMMGMQKRKEADKLLKRVFKGEKVISDMVANAHKEMK